MLQKSKCGYVINHGIAPCWERLLLQEVTNSPFYVLSFDASLNKHLQKGQIDIIVRYWNGDKFIVETRYLTSELLGTAKAVDILEKFESGVGTKINNLKNLLQISSDGPSVNLNELPSFLNIGTCGLHTVHGSLKAAVKSTDWSIGKVLKPIATVLNDSPARRDMSEEVTESNTYPLPYCGLRWCENEDCLERADEI